MPLTESEIHQFQKSGYVVKAGVFTATDLQPFKKRISQIVDEEVKGHFEKKHITNLYEEDGFETRLARIYAESNETGQAIAGTIMGKGGGGFSDHEILDILRHPPLVDCVSDLVGQGVVGSSVYRIRIKLPQYSPGEVPWHQDSGYFLAHCDKQLIVTCWIPLVDATIGNGCLYVLPEAHQHGIHRHYTGGHAGFLEIPDDELLPRDPVPVEMKQGDVLFLTNLTPHASFKNNSEIVRWSIDLRYQSMDVPNNVNEDPATYVPERDTVTMACYPSEADFIIRDNSDPEREINTPGAFKKIRERYEQMRPHNPGRGWTRLSDRT